jgi:hypothetical protein
MLNMGVSREVHRSGILSVGWNVCRNVCRTSRDHNHNPGDASCRCGIVMVAVPSSTILTEVPAGAEKQKSRTGCPNAEQILSSDFRLVSEKSACSRVLNLAWLGLNPDPLRRG